MNKLITISAILIICVSHLCEAQIIRDRESKFIVNIGDETPRFEYTTAEGDTLDTDFLNGQTTLIQFAASWCPYSRDQLKYIEKNIWRKYQKNSNFNLICFCVDQPSDISNFNKIITEENLTFPISYDPNEKIYQLFVTPQGSVTRSILINNKDRIVYLSDAFYKKNFRRTAKMVKKQLSDKK